jgi:hypothetical protein
MRGFGADYRFHDRYSQFEKIVCEKREVKTRGEIHPVTLKLNDLVFLIASTAQRCNEDRWATVSVEGNEIGVVRAMDGGVDEVSENH